MFTHIQSVYFESSASHLPRNLFTWNLHASKTCLGSIHGSKIQVMNLGREEENSGGGFTEECSDVTLSNRSSCAIQVCEYTNPFERKTIFYFSLPYISCRQK